MQSQPTPNDLALMRRAIELSRQGFPAPNPHVGCVVAQGRQVVGEGFHHFAGGPHAEAVALEQAGMHAAGSSVYVTLEPCNHQGRTPPCSRALVEAKVRKVFVAVSDPNPTAAGGAKTLREHGIEVIEGFLTEEARSANLMWLTAIERGSPFLVVKVASSLDGRIATQSGESKWITGELARRAGQALRAECGAVLVGRATVQLDHPRLTVRDFEVVNQPRKIILDPWRKLPQKHEIFSENAIRVVAGEAREGELKVATNRAKFELDDLLHKLFDLGITSVLVEGGAKTISHFISEDCFDRLELFVSGKIIGTGKNWLDLPLAGPLRDRPHLQFRQVEAVGEDLRIGLTSTRTRKI